MKISVLISELKTVFQCLYIRYLVTQPTPVFLPGESYGQRNLQATVHGVMRVRHNLVTKPPPPPRIIKEIICKESLLQKVYDLIDFNLHSLNLLIL